MSVPCGRVDATAKRKLNQQYVCQFHIHFFYICVSLIFSQSHCHKKRCYKLNLSLVITKSHILYFITVFKCLLTIL